MDALLAGWGEQTAIAAAGRHVLAIQDTSEINFRTTPERRRDLGEIGKGVGRGLLLHAMLALDEVAPVSWTPNHLCFRSSRCQRSNCHTLRNSGNG